MKNKYEEIYNLAKYNFQTVVDWLNEKDVDYYGWRDIEMCEYYLESN